MAELDKAAELATEAVEETAAVVRNHLAWWWGGWATGMCLGGGSGYLLSRKLLETKYEKVAEAEIDQMREHFRKRTVAREDKPAVGDLSKVAEKLGYAPTPSAPVPAPPVTPPAPGEPNVQTSKIFKGIFDSAKDPLEGWDYEAEVAQRKPGGIYIIHRDEFGEDDNEETTLSYYAGDDVLCDSQDRIVDDQNRLVGNCLDQFGHGSGDRNVVYVRNSTLGIDLEVIKSDKTYAEEVHGFKHEDPPRRRGPKYQD